MDALGDLERRVEAAAKAIEKLKRENRSLRSKVKKLEGGKPAAAAWSKERKVVQERLTDLADHLDDLLPG